MLAERDHPNVKQHHVKQQLYQDILNKHASGRPGEIFQEAKFSKKDGALGRETMPIFA
ncbi:hypothetical protein PCAR4_290079 [Paraburkholderia caribensis]|nr:hypothetical protein PCAR4_290079 [Paraburkholderia caribensis]